MKIRRQVSRLGRIIPVLEVEPRRLYGTTVQSVTMVSEGWLRTHRIAPGAVILITKANEIIPQFLSTVMRSPYEQPTSCPRCGGPVKFLGDHLHCTRNCVGKGYRPKHFVWTYAGLLGYGNSALSHIFKTNNINSMDDLLEKAGKLDGNGLSDHESVFLNHINKKLSGPLAIELLLVSLNLPGVGATWSRKLVPFLKAWLENRLTKPPFDIHSNVYNALVEHADLIEKVYRRFEWVQEGENHGITR